MKAGSWSETVNLPKYDSNGDEITYIATEQETGSIFYVKDEGAADLTVTNKFVVPADTKPITVIKVWDDNNNAPVEGENGPRPTTPITIVFKGGENDIEKTLRGTGDTWTQSYDLPKYDSNGNEITYTVDEKTVPAWYVKSSVVTTTDSTTKIPTTTITNSIPRIEVTKTIKSINGENATTVNSSVVKENDVIEYLITVKNLGTVELTNVNVTDNLDIYTDPTKPENTTHTLLTNGTLAVEETKTYTVYYKVSANDVKVGGQTLTNTATATGEYKDSNNTTQTVKHEDSADVEIAAVPGVKIEKTQTVTRNGNTLDADAKVQPGDVINYTITVTNTGNTVLNNVTVTDSMTGKEGFTITSGSLNIGTLGIAPNNVATITATYTVQESDMQETESKIANTATVKTSSTPETSSTVEVPTEAWYADINVTKSSELIKNTTLGNKIAGKAEYGDTIRYTITATNSGKKAGTVDVTDKVPVGTELIPYVSNSTNLTSEELAKLATEAGLTKTLSVSGKDSTSIYFTVKVTAKPGEEIVNTATLPKDNDKEVSDGGQNVEKRVSVVTKTETPKITNSNVVIVLDISGSMKEQDVKVLKGYDRWGNPKYEYKTREEVAKEAVKDFIDTINLPNGGNNGSAVSVITFRGPDTWGDVTGTAYTNVLNVNSNGNTIATTKNQAEYLKAQVDAVNVPEVGGTVISGALQRATKQVIALKDANSNNQNIVIFVGDGAPQCDGGDITEEANKLKATGAIVYTIGFQEDVDILEEIATEGKYYTTSDDVDLSKVFTKVGSSINPAPSVDVDSEDGLIELTNIDISKGITIKVKANDATDFEETTGKYNATNPTVDDKYIQDKITKNAETGVYYLDLSKFEADDTIEIDYFINESQD